MEKEEIDSLIVAEEEINLRLDRLLTFHFPNYSRTYFQYLIANNLVLVEGKPLKKRAFLKAGDEIEIQFSLTPEISLSAEKIPLDILYEDEFLLAINKPAGMVVHPGAGNWSGTFVNALLFHCKQLENNTLRPGIVHRLDKDTTGVLLAAKTELAHQRLIDLFSSRKVHKEYLAICIGNPGNRNIEGAIGRHPIRRKEMAIVDEGGKEARTCCKTLAYNSTLSFVRLFPETGRTHQLRVHLKSIQTPILGDLVYGIPSINKKFEIQRQFLHAEILIFQHPLTNKTIELKAPLPTDMAKFLCFCNF